MKTTLTKNIILLAVLLLHLFTAITASSQATRQGALDLTNREGDALIIPVYTQSNHSESLGNTPFTIGMWVKMVENSDNEMVLLKLDGGPYKISLSWLTNHFLLEAEGGDLGNWWTDIDDRWFPSSSNFLNNWHYVSFAYDGGYGVRISVDDDYVWVGLYNDDTPIYNFFPGITPTLYIGGHQLRNPSLGKMFVGEISVWREYLSNDVLTEYYDEEINSSHPNWNKLYRYYHCTQDFVAQGGITYMPNNLEPVYANNGIATVTDNTNNRVVSDQYPPIHPPRIAGGRYNVSARASTCGADSISINWNNFANRLVSSYLIEHDANYALSRDDNPNGNIYTGSDFSFTDRAVSSGDAFRYRLRTYWEINGTKFYSKDDVWTDHGSVRTHYGGAELSASTDNCDGSITLDWTAENVPPAWKLQRSPTRDFSTGVFTLSSSIEGTAATYNDIPPLINTNFYYRIIALGSDENNCTVSAESSDTISGYSASVPTPPTSITLTPNTSEAEIVIEWTAADTTADSWIVRRTDQDGTNAVEFADITGTMFIDSTVLPCTIYKYTVGAVNACAIGEFFNTKSAAIGNSDLDNKIAFLEASKGYFGDGVQLNWGINGTFSSIEGFIIERSVAGENNYEAIASLNNLQTIYKDATALGGVLYDYRIQATADCSGNMVFSNDATDLGFTIPFGVANGHVEYEGGNAVEGVKISIEPKQGLGGKSIYLDGEDDYVQIDGFEGVEGAEPRTIEVWVKMPTDVVNVNFLSYGNLTGPSGDGYPFVFGTNYQGQLMVGQAFGGLAQAGSDLRDDQWHHVAIVVPEGAVLLNDIKWFIDGKEHPRDSSLTSIGELNTPASNKLVIGSDLGSALMNNFSGYIDEVRFWNVALSSEEIGRNYSRILNGNEEGLIGYWRCDEGIGNTIYDASKTGMEYNKNDGLFVNGVRWTNETPTADQLGINAYTDEFGDYSSEYIPYRFGGELFKVTPSLGVHEFSPNSRTIYLGNGDATQNNLDFTDISAFTVTGTVKYYNSTFPVKGAQILIDGDPAVNAEKSIVTTDNLGHFTVNVPIGYHYISVEKDGHVFSSGYFPSKNDNGSLNYYEFNDDVYGIEFIDSTFVKILGRVVGGTREGDKEVGFGLSTNNIGVSDVIFKAQNEAYDLNVADESLFSVLSTQTDPNSGEFEIHLIPESFEIQKAGNDNYAINVNDLSVLNLSSSLTPTVVYDSTLVESNDGDFYEVDSNWYHHKLNFIVRESPRIQVSDENGNNFIGDTILTFRNQATGEFDTLNLATGSPYPYPIFQMGKTYNMFITVQEEYSNPDHPLGALVDNVPIEDALITCVNNLMIDPQGESFRTDENGMYEYSFRAGLPNVSIDETDSSLSYTKNLQLYATSGATTVQWRSDNPFRGYILGSLPLEGTDFVTYGYEIPEIVLRDPPGTNSYAYIEQGSKFSRRQSWEMNYNTQSAIDHHVHSGVRFGLGGGLTGPLIETQIYSDSEYGMQTTRATDNEGALTETVEFTRRIETSSDPEDVGSDADLFIGHAYNAYFTQSKNLRLLPKQYCIDNDFEFIDIAGAEYVLGVMNGLVMDQGNTSTYFVYSQKHILSELIPNLIVARDNLLATSKYTSNLPRTSPLYGLNNDDDSFDEMKRDSLALNPDFDTTSISYSFNGDLSTEDDSVSFFNDQVTYWMNAIAKNEAEKANAEIVQNLSIDGSSGAYSETISQAFNSEFNWKSTRQLKFKMNALFRSVVGNSGYTGESKFTLTGELVQGTNESEVNEVTFGYVIDESDEGDYYSIDVKHEQGIPIYAYDKFTESVTSKSEFLAAQGEVLGFGLGAFAASKTISKISTKLFARSNYWAAVAVFGIDMGVFIAEICNMANDMSYLYDDIDNNNSFGVAGFDIGSPIFSVRGGQSRCPYEGADYAFFALDNSGDLASLNTATVQREVPVIDVEEALITGVPENNTANFTLKLQNESGSSDNMWYELSIDESTNPNGAVLLIDGLSPERQFLIPAWETLTKTLTVAKGQPEVYEYDSIALILHSVCQFDPSNEQADIADTIYISAHFAPTCTEVSIKGMQDNWVANYDNGGEKQITLSDFDVNYSTLEKIQFQYKTLTGSPVSTIAYFAEEGTAYAEYTGDKTLLSGNAEESFIWDISSLNDREYLIRAQSTCSDGSSYQSPWYSGLLDSKPPKLFGTPEPGDGILSAGENLSVRFDEDLEQGIITENNFSIRGVINGSEISHNASLYFDGTGDYCSVNSGINITNRSFTIEFWLKKLSTGEAVVFSQGTDASQNLEIGFNASDMFYLQVDGQSFEGDPSVVYNAVYPADAWHHYAVTYNKEDSVLSLYADDQNILSQSGVSISYQATGQAFIGKSATGSENYLHGNIHEFRIWNDARLFASEIYANLYTSLSGREQGAYRIWEMNEGRGDFIADKVRNQVMNVHAQWSIEPDGTAVYFDGTNQYLELNGTNMIIDDETDFTIEFWFKANVPSDTVTLLSNGKGDGVEVMANGFTARFMSINALPNGNIQILSDGYEFTAVSNNYFDNNWHHFALSVNRNANARSFIDGELQNYVNADSIAQLFNAKIWIGARGWQTDPANYEFDSYFNGYLDEVRFWKTARTENQINLYNNSKLNGNEIGLLGYYPFEQYTEENGISILGETWTDQWINPIGENNGEATPINSTTFSEDAAEIKDARPVIDIPFDFAVNGDEIILTPTIDPYRIENINLDISVQDVFDLNGNRLLSPVTWIAYVDQNQVVWEENGITLEKELNAAKSFTSNIQNLGGEAKEYTIDNLPNWLTAFPSSGVIEPNSTVEVRFTINEGVNTGNFNENIILSTNFAYNELFEVNLRVYKPEPSWEVDASAYQYVSNVVAKLKIANQFSSDVHDKIAAFSGDECRGVANIRYIESRDEYFAFLTLHANTPTEKLSYRVWDASEGEIYADVSPEVSFRANAVEGSFSAPIVFECGYQLVNEIFLPAGWSWISFNLDMSNYESVTELLANINATDGDVIKSGAGYATYDAANELWIENNLPLEAGRLYKVKLAQENLLRYSGSAISPTDLPIAIDNGWNRIGYIPRSNIEVNQSLAAYGALENDVLKNKSNFSLFDGNEWLGSLAYMQQGEGYMLKSQTNSATSFYYPSESSLSDLKSGYAALKATQAQNECSANPLEYEFSMTVTGTISIDGMSSLDTNDIVYAYIGGECRGSANLQYFEESNSYFVLYTIFSNSIDGERISFKVYDASSSSTEDCIGTIEFAPEATVGSIDQPYVFTNRDETSNTVVSIDKSDISITPNPASSYVQVHTRSKIESIRIFNSIGILVLEQLGQSNSVRMVTANLTTGLYVVEVQTETETYSEMLIIEKTY